MGNGQRGVVLDSVSFQTDHLNIMFYITSDMSFTVALVFSLNPYNMHFLYQLTTNHLGYVDNGIVYTI